MDTPPNARLHGIEQSPQPWPNSAINEARRSALHAARFTLVAIGSEGIISFPSLHAALAVILVIAVWPIPVLGWLALVLNVAMLVATPIDGSHYFSDVLAGVAVSVFSFAAASWIAGCVGRWSAPTTYDATAQTMIFEAVGE